jgi:hypothetical protein
MEIINRMNRESDKRTNDNHDDAVNETKKDPNYKSYFIKISPSKIAHSIIIIKPPSKEEGKKRKGNFIKQGQVGDVVH